MVRLIFVNDEGSAEVDLPHDGAVFGRALENELPVMADSISGYSTSRLTIGAIKDDILDTEGLAVLLCKKLRALYPALLSTRYKLTDQDLALPDYELFLQVGKKRGFLISGGEINTERTAAVLLDEFRAAKIGRITLDRVPEKDGGSSHAGTND